MSQSGVDGAVGNLCQLWLISFPHRFNEEDLLTVSESETTAKGAEFERSHDVSSSCSTIAAVNSCSEVVEKKVPQCLVCMVSCNLQRHFCGGPFLSHSSKLMFLFLLHCTQDVYENPLVSVQCWHVFCDQCWLKALATQKLCPKCKTITCPGDLRRIFL